MLCFQPEKAILSEHKNFPSTRDNFKSTTNTFESLELCSFRFFHILYLVQSENHMEKYFCTQQHWRERAENLRGTRLFVSAFCWCCVRLFMEINHLQQHARLTYERNERMIDNERTHPPDVSRRQRAQNEATTKICSTILNLLIRYNFVFILLPFFRLLSTHVSKANCSRLLLFNVFALKCLN